MTGVEVSVIVINWKTKDYLAGCLDSLRDGGLQGVTADVWVIDNGSDDGSAEMVRARYPWVTLIANDANLGFSAANNAAMRAAPGTFLLLLNADMLVPAGLIRQMVARVRAAPEVGLAACRQVDAEGRELESYMFDYMSGYIPEVAPLAPRPTREGEAVDVSWVWGAGMLVRREVVEQTGGFDESFFMYYEDLEWCRRIREKGWKVVCYLDLTVTHFVRASTSMAPPAATAARLVAGQLSLLAKYTPRSKFRAMMAWRFLYALRGIVFYRVMSVLAPSEAYTAKYWRYRSTAAWIARHTRVLHRLVGPDRLGISAVCTRGPVTAAPELRRNGGICHRGDVARGIITEGRSCRSRARPATLPAKSNMRPGQPHAPVGDAASGTDRAAQGKMVLARRAELSVIVVNWNGGPALDSCLGSLAEATRGRDVELWVVDNASSDGSAERAAARRPWVKLIRNAENVGFARAANQALKEAEGQVYMLLNPDAQIGARALAEFLGLIARDGRVGIVGCGSADASGREVPGCETSFPGKRRRPVRQTEGEGRDVAWVSGACLVARRGLVEDIGLLDERFFMYYEDVDWCYRARDAGWRVVWLPGVKIRHELGGSARRVDRAETARRAAESRLLFYRKHHSALRAMVLRLRMAAWALAGVALGAGPALLNTAAREELTVRLEVMRAAVRTRTATRGDRA